MSLPPFTTMPSTVAKEAIRAEQIDALADRASHVRSTLYDPDVHDPVIAHDHDFRNSAGVHASHLPNLILNGHPRAGWTCTLATMTSNGLQFTASSQRATRQLLDPGTSGASRFAWGSGGEAVLSFYARLSGGAPLNTATVNWGLTNGNTTTYLTGLGRSITAAALAADWRRFYARLTPITDAGVTTYMAVGFSTSGTFTGGPVQVDHVMLKVGDRLTAWEPGCAEDVFGDWKELGEGTCPVLDAALSFDDAVLVT